MNGACGALCKMMSQYAFGSYTPQTSVEISTFIQACFVLRCVLVIMQGAFWRSVWLFTGLFW